MAIPRQLTTDETKRFNIEIPNVYALSFPYVLLLDDGQKMRQLATSGSEKSLITEGRPGRFHLEKHHGLLVVQTPYPPLWSPVHVIWERRGPAVGRPASLASEEFSWDYGAGRIILRQIPLADDVTSELVNSAAKRGAPLTLTIPLPELGLVAAAKKVIIVSLKRNDDDVVGEDKQCFSGITYSVAKSAHEVIIEFEADGKGSIRIVPIDDGGL